MITYNLENRGNKPLYQFLYECLRNDIIEGRIASGSKLPSKRTFARNLGVGVNTVTTAYEQLVAEGFVYAEEKRGYFAAHVEAMSAPAVSKPNPLPLAVDDDSTCFMDFRANRVNLGNFPEDAWRRCLRKAILDGGESLYQTIPYAGLPKLRNAIADYLYANRGLSVDPARIIVGAGTEYLIRRLFDLFGNDVAFGIESTGFKKLAAHAERFHARAVIVPPTWSRIEPNLDDKRRANENVRGARCVIADEGLNLDVLRNSNAKVMYVSPANRFPSGRIMPINTRVSLLNWAYERPDRFIVEDDYDSEFRYSGRAILPLYAEDTHDRVIYLNTFSKTMVPSLRISYMILPKVLMQRYEETLSFYSCSASSLEQYALADFIESGTFERHINKLRAFYGRQRTTILNQLNASPLMNIADIEAHRSGTHFLLRVRTEWPKEEISRRGNRLGLRISFFSDYSMSDIDRPGEVTLVMNYAAIAPNQVTEVVARLNRLFLG